MTFILDRLHPFIPGLDLWMTLGPFTLVYACGAAWFSGWLRHHREVRVAYTRKIFHFLIIPVAAIIQIDWGLGGTVVYGTVVTTLVLWAVFQGKGFAFYDALARPKDQPHQSLFILVPLAMTGGGGVVSNLFFGSYATVGYWVCGFGDAVGEPVGSRWGNHPYQVPSMGGVPATRTLEGSAAVGVSASVAAVLALLHHGTAMETALVTGVACGVATCLIEAVSNHGLDNITTQLAGAGVAYLLLGL